MKIIDGYAFPETAEEAKAWQETIYVKALARRVLAVAVTRVEGTWRAYCDAVDGRNHDNEWQEVREQGVSLPHDIAASVFPRLADVPYAR